MHIHMCESKVRSCKQKIICTYTYILHSTVSSWLQKGHRNFVDKNTFFFVTTFFCFLRLRPIFPSVRYSITTVKIFQSKGNAVAVDRSIDLWCVVHNMLLITNTPIFINKIRNNNKIVVVV
jgi:hypothetical protein